MVRTIREIEQLARYDGCPECVHNYELPLRVRPTQVGSFLADYRCASCLHEWTTSWGDDL